MKTSISYKISLITGKEPYALHIAGDSFGTFRTLLAAKRRLGRFIRTSQSQSELCELKTKNLSK